MGVLPTAQVFLKCRSQMLTSSDVVRGERPVRLSVFPISGSHARESPQFRIDLFELIRPSSP
jgi:hypothetical protein